jgi:small multidrug resistance pump
MMPYLYLIGAVVFEVIGTSALQASQQFTKPKPLILTAIGYGAAFYLLSLVLRTMPVGIAYAIWSGLGVILITLVGLVWFGQRLDLPAIIGLTLIVVGVVTINLFSQSVVH